MAKEKVSFDPNLRPEALLQRLSDAFSDAGQNWEDGLKIDFENAWLHVRKSNTEPILRIYTEATNVEEAQALAEKARQILLH
jgi:phosphomannomutase